LALRVGGERHQPDGGQRFKLIGADVAGQVEQAPALNSSLNSTQPVSGALLQLNTERLLMASPL